MRNPNHGYLPEVDSVVGDLLGTYFHHDQEIKGTRYLELQRILQKVAFY